MIPVKKNNLKIVPIGFEREIDVKNGHIFEKYFILGEKFPFNLNGLAFTFEAFTFEIERNNNEIISILLKAEEIVCDSVIHLTTIINGVSPSKEDILKKREHDIVLEIKPEIISEFINPSIKTEEQTTLETLINFQDPISGQFILRDFYFYQIKLIL